MPSLGGFYLSPKAWTDWINTQDHTFTRYGPPTVEVLIGRKLREKGMRPLFGLDIIPPVYKDGKRVGEGWGVMVYRRKYKRGRVYLPPQSEIDHNAKEILEEHVGLKDLEWSTVWYDPQSEDAESEVLGPPEEAAKS